MNPEKQLSQIDMSYRFKYIALGLVIYVVGKYAWKVYKDQTKE